MFFVSIRFAFIGFCCKGIIEAFIDRTDARLASV